MRILILDDDAEYSEQVAANLRRKEPADDVLALSTADAVREAVRTVITPFDVFLIDQKLDRGQDGIELLRELRALSPDTDAIIFTGYNDPDSGLRAYEAGAHQYLPKPINVPELHWVLQLLRDARAVEQERLWLRILTEVTETTQRTLRWAELANKLTHGALRLGFERAQLWQLMADGETLVGVGQAGVDELPDFTGLRLPLAKAPYSLRALASREPVFFQGNELGSDYWDLWPNYRMPAGEWANLPLWMGDRCLGFLILDNAQQPCTFSATQSNFLHLLGNQAAAALERARAFEAEERKSKELALLNEIGRDVAAHNDVDDLLRKVRQCVGKLMSVRNFAVVLREDDRLDVRLQFEHDRAKTRRTLDRMVGLVGHVIQHNMPLLLPTKAENTACLNTHHIELIDEQAKCWLGVPLRVAGQVLGALVVQSYRREYAFTEEDRRWLGAVADQVAGAIRIAQLADQEHDKAQQLDLLHRASTELIKLAEENEDYFWRAAFTAITAEYGLKFNRAALFLLDRNGEQIRGRMGIGHFDEQQARLSWEQDRSLRLTFRRMLALLREGRIDPTPVEQSVREWQLPLRRNEVFAQALRQTHCVHVPAVTAATAGGARLPVEFIERFGAADYVVAPLRAGRKPLGVVVVDNAHDQKSISAESLKQLEALLAQIGLIFDNVQQRRAQERLIAVSNTIMSKVNDQPLKTTLNQLVQAALDLTEADCALIYPLRIGAETWHLETEQIGSAGQRSDLHLSRPPAVNGVTAEIVRQGELIVPDIQQHRTLYSGQPLSKHTFLKAEGIHAFIGLIIRDLTDDEPLGIFYLDYRRARQQFSTHEQRVAELLASLAAVAIRTAHAAQQARDGLAEAQKIGQVSRRELELLHGVLEQALKQAEQEEKDLAAVILKTARELLPQPDTQVGLLLRHWASATTLSEPHEERYQYFLNPDGSVEHIRESQLYRGITGLALRTGKTQFAPDVQEPPWAAHYLARFPQTRAELDVPIRSHDRVVGVFNVEAPTPGAFDREHRQSLERLAAVTALALDNFQRQSHLRNVLQAAQAITNPYGLRTTLNAVRDEVQRALPDLACLTIWHKAANSNRVELGSYFGVRHADAMEGEEVNEGGVVWQVMHASGPIWAEAAAQESQLRHRFIEAEGIISVAAFPLWAADETIGAMFFNYREAHHFSEEEKTLFPILAAIVAASIRDAAHLEKERLATEAERKQHERLSAALAITQAVGVELDLHETLRRIMAQLYKLFKGTHPCVLTYDADDQMLEFQPASLEFYHPDDPLNASVQRVDVAGKSIASRTAHHSLLNGEPMMFNVGNVFDDSDYLPLIQATRSEICVTLMGQDGLLGVLAIESPDFDDFDESDEQLVQGVAQQISLALDRARQSAQLQFSNTIAATTAWAVDIAHDINKEIGRIRNWVGLLEDSPLSEADRRYLQGIDASAGRLEETLKGAVKQVHSQPQLVEIDATLRDWVNGQLKNQPKLQAVFSLNCPGIQALIHRTELQRVVRHLVRNALDHTSRGGPLYVRTEALNEQWIKIEFEDSGLGLPETLWPNLFQGPVRRSDGTLGFGLLFVRFIVEEMGGSIRARKPQPGRGAVFVLRLPLAQPLSQMENSHV